MVLSLKNILSKNITGSGHYGFTLIELMIVIAMTGTLAGIAIPTYMSYEDKAKVFRTIVEIKDIEKEIISYNLEYNKLPVDLAEIGLEGMLDPYGYPYQYQPVIYVDKHGEIKKSQHCRKDHNLVPINTDFDLYSMGKDGDTAAPFTAKQSRDDIVRANDGQFIGLVSAY